MKYLKKTHYIMIAVACALIVVFGYLLPFSTSSNSSMNIEQLAKERNGAFLAYKGRGDLALEKQYKASRYANKFMKSLVFPVDYQSFIKKNNDSTLMKDYKQGKADYRLWGDFKVQRIIRGSGVSNDGITLVMTCQNQPFGSGGILDKSSLNESAGIVFYNIPTSKNNESYFLQKLADKSEDFELSFSGDSCPLIFSTDSGSIHITPDNKQEKISINSVSIPIIHAGKSNTISNN